MEDPLPGSSDNSGTEEGDGGDSGDNGGSYNGVGCDGSSVVVIEQG